jgi:exosortase F-associated protein
VKQSINYWRVMIAGACGLGLLVIFLFQKINYAAGIGIEGETAVFIVNKSLRFLANDFLMIGLIYALFQERKYVIFALWVQLVGFVVILIPYFLLKLVFHTGNGPLVSFLHRLVLNPMLLMLLIPAFYYQRSKDD